MTKIRTLELALLALLIGGATRPVHSECSAARGLIICSMNWPS